MRKRPCLLPFPAPFRGKSTNTGCLAPLSLPGQSQMLLKGYKEHDDELERLMADPTITTAVLWPGRCGYMCGGWEGRVWVGAQRLGVIEVGVCDGTFRLAGVCVGEQG